MKVSRSRSGAVGRVLTCSRSVSGRRSFANTVASWFDTGAPGRFVPTYRDWQTSGALFQDMAGTRVTALEQAVAVDLDRSRNLALGPELWLTANVSGGWTNNGDGSYTKLAGTGNGNLGQPNLVAGRVYRMVYTIVSQTNTQGARAIMGASTIGPWGTVGKNTIDLLAQGGTIAYLNSGGAGDVVVRDISVREIPGAHRIQPTSQSRPIITARKNEYTETEFRNGVADAPARGGLISAASMTGYLGAIALGYDGVTSSYAYKQDVWLPNTPYLQSVDVEALDGLGPPVFGTGTGTGNSPLNDFALVMAGLAIGITYTVVPLGGNFYRVLGALTTGASISINTGGVIKYAANTPRLFRFTAYSRVKGFVAGRYQRVNTATDYNAGGFPVGLRYDQIDDTMPTAAPIDYSGTDKVTLCVPFRKDADAAGMAVIEHGPSVNTTVGTFALFSPDAAGPRVGAYARGAATSSSAVVTNVVAPISLVALQSADLATSSNTLEINGVPAASSATPLGGGMLSSQVSWAGSRGGASARFLGILYGELEIGNLRTANERAYLAAEFAKNLSEAL